MEKEKEKMARIEERESYVGNSFYHTSIRFSLIGNINFNYIKQITGSTFIIKYLNFCTSIFLLLNITYMKFFHLFLFLFLVMVLSFILLKHSFTYFHFVLFIYFYLLNVIH